MTPYETAVATLQAALVPVAAYCEKAHQTADAGNPAHAGRLQHVAKLDALLEAVADYGDEAEAERAHLLRYKNTADAHRQIAEEFRQSYLQESGYVNQLRYEGTMLYRLLLQYLTPEQIAAAIPARRNESL